MQLLHYESLMKSLLYFCRISLFIFRYFIVIVVIVIKYLIVLLLHIKCFKCDC